VVIEPQSSIYTFGYIVAWANSKKDDRTDLIALKTLFPGSGFTATDRIGPIFETEMP
jgi:hypothetical protein